MRYILQQNKDHGSWHLSSVARESQRSEMAEPFRTVLDEPYQSNAMPP